MENLNKIDNLCLISESNNKQFHHTRVMLTTFMSKNKWFDGTVVILTLESDPLSDHNINLLKLIYDDIKFIGIPDSDIDELKSKVNKRRELVDILDYLKIFAFKVKSNGNLYISRFASVIGDMSNTLSNSQVSIAATSENFPNVGLGINAELMFIPETSISDDNFNRLYEILLNSILDGSYTYMSTFLESNSRILPATSLVNANIFPNNKYTNFIRYSKSISAILINTPILKNKNFNKIQTYWSQLMHKSQKLLNHPSKVNTRVIQTKDPFTVSPEINESRKANLVTLNPKDFKFMVLVPVHGRFQVLKLFSLGIECLKKQGYNIDVLAVGSSEQDRKNCKELNFKYVSHRNILGEKLNVALRHSKQFEFDGMLMLGSDDILNSDVLDFYVSEFNKGSRFVGFIDCYFYSLEQSKLLKWNGYSTPERAGEPIGAWRCFKRDLIEDLGWTLWGNQRKSIDASMWKKIKNMKDITTATLSESMFICDLKTSENVTKFTRFKNSVLSDTNKIKLLKDRDIIEKIINY